MKCNQIAVVAPKALPASSLASVTYNPEKNVYLTLCHTSVAGNTYFKAVRFSEDVPGYLLESEYLAYFFIIALLNPYGGNDEIALEYTDKVLARHQFQEGLYVKSRAFLNTKLLMR